MKTPNQLCQIIGSKQYCVQFLCTLILLFISINSFSQTPAFPNVEGGGSLTTGGRGGIVVKVTTLNDSGPGSLREALMMTVPRIIVFDVSGNIVLNSRLELILENSNFTVAGQSAPQGGITITNNFLLMGGGWNRANEPCNNAIFRYIRFRNARYTGASDVVDHNGLLSTGCVGLVLDHCSFSFCDDQALSMGGTYGELTDMTIQNCIFSENATGIITGLVNPFVEGRISFIKNLFVDQSHRTPNIGGELQYDVINNVYFNWASRLTNINASNPEVNYIGNYLREGSYTNTGHVNQVQISTGTVPQIYTANNYHNSYYQTPQLDDRNLWQRFVNSGSVPSSMFTTTMFPIMGGYVPTTAQEAYINVLADVGTNKYLNEDGTYGIYIDSFDTTKISNVQNSISNDPYNKVWTLPNIPFNTRPANYDTDDDGMADLWEVNTFGDLSRIGNGDEDGDGYTNVEEFLNGVDSTQGTNGITANAGNDVSICEGASTLLTASGGVTYQWNTGATTASITVNPNSTTTYTVIAFDDAGNNSDPDDVIVTVNSIPVADAGQDIETCQGNSVLLTANGGTSYLWNTGAITQNISVNPNVTTTYSVEVTQNGCSDTDDIIVTVNPLPNVDAGLDITINYGDSTVLTANGADSYVWNTGDSTQSITVNPTVETTYTVTGTTGTCLNTDSVTVFLVGSEVVANAGNDQTICNGLQATIIATGGAAYVWNTGETTASIDVSPSSTTTYTVTAFDSTGTVSDTDNVIINVTTNPVANAGNDVEVCDGTSVTLSASGGSNYIWNTGETTQSINVSPITTTTYSVEVIENNCSSNDEVIVVVNELPAVNAGSDVTIGEGESTTLIASGADSYLWNTGETTQSIEVTPGNDTIYSVTGFLNGCESTDDVTVTVETETVVANAGEDVTICEDESTILTATGGATYLWNTGDTTSSIEVSPNTTTTYTVTAINSFGTSSDADDVIVTVDLIPTVDAGIDVTITEGENTTLTASGAQTYIWSTGETTQSIDVSPTSTITYTVTGFSNSCDATDDVTVTVETESVNANAGADETMCAGESITLTATGGTTYQWNTGETTTIIEVSPNVTTTYTVTAFNALGTSSDSDDVIVTVNATPIANAGNDVEVCEDSSVTLTATGGTTYQWNTGETSQSIIVNPNTTTTYSVEVFENNCSDNDEVVVTINALPNTNAGSDVTITEGESTTLNASGAQTYIWSTGETTQSIDVNPTSTITYSVTGFSNGCEASDEVTVTVETEFVNANAGENVSICEGESTILTATGGTTYEWNTGETNSSIEVNPSTTTTYTVTAFNALGTSSDTDDVTVTINSIPVANAGTDVVICQGSSATLTASGGASYLWNTGETSQSIIVNPNTTTTYSVEVIQNNCSSADEVNVTVNNLPNVNAGSDITIIEGESNTLTVSGADTYLWNTGETTQTININPLVTTIYSVTGFSNGCEATDEVLVTVEPFVFVANAGEDQFICEDTSTTLTASEGDSYLWSTGETTQSIVVSPWASETFTVTVFEGDEQAQDDVTVFVNLNPNVVIMNGGEVTILEGEFITLSASGANTYEWDIEGANATEPNIAVSPSTSRTYSVTGFINNCSDEKSITVNVVEEVVAYAGEDLTICADEMVTLTANGGEDYLWNTGEVTQSINVTPGTDTEYSVLVYNALSSDEATVMVFVNDCSAVVIPEADQEFDFLIYQDVKADVLKVQISGMDRVDVDQLVIYDITGKIIYSEQIRTDENTQSLDKEINSSPFSRGIYIVRLIYDDTEILKKIPIR